MTRDLLLTHLAGASVAASFLIVSSVGLGYSYRLTSYVNPPQPRRLAILLEKDPSDLKRAIFAALVEAHARKEETIRRRIPVLEHLPSLLYMRDKPIRPDRGDDLTGDAAAKKESRPSNEDRDIYEILGVVRDEELVNNPLVKGWEPFRRKAK